MPYCVPFAFCAARFCGCRRVNGGPGTSRRLSELSRERPDELARRCIESYIKPLGSAKLSQRTRGARLGRALQV